MQRWVGSCHWVARRARAVHQGEGWDGAPVVGQLDRAVARPANDGEELDGAVGAWTGNGRGGPRSVVGGLLRRGRDARACGVVLDAHAHDASGLLLAALLAALSTKS